MQLIARHGGQEYNWRQGRKAYSAKTAIIRRRSRLTSTWLN